MSDPLADNRTTIAIQRVLNDLAGVNGSSQAEPVVRDLLGRAVDRLFMLCGRMLHRSYPRLTRGPTNLTTDELVGSVVERLLKALREVRPVTVRQFFALANKHIRWELNDLARHLDRQATTAELHDSRFVSPKSTDSTPDSLSEAGIAPRLSRILEAIESLPPDEKEVFELVRIQGLSHPEAASIAGVSEKTIQRRLNRALVLLGRSLEDLIAQRPAIVPRADDAGAGTAAYP